MTQHHPTLAPYDLMDRYTRSEGRVFLTGTQALVRIMFDQAQRDRAAGMRTAGFVSGYRGSPLGGLDQEFWRNSDLCAAHDIRVKPAINEDLGATAVLGAQQASLAPGCEVEGVFSMWYGKGPGVDRSGDALRHGNAYGSAPKGGVLVVAGDDHGSVSSSMPHQSDVAFMTWMMPVLNPASVAEYLAFGEYGYALSRFSGTWVGFKAISETVESGMSIELALPRAFAQPDFTAPPGGLHVRGMEMPSPELETRMEAKLRAVEAFVEANPIDHALYGLRDAHYGIVTTGKAHLDVMEALRLMGLGPDECRAVGLDIYKVGMPWPLPKRAALNFVAGKQEVLVVEEKRGIIESQLKEYFYDWPGHKPDRMVGKHDETLKPLVPWTGELSPRQLVPILAKRLDGVFPGQNFAARAARITKDAPPVLSLPGATRTPYFCSGCPHNSSTKVPEGSKAASGIGCHVMASWMGRETGGFAQMGGEGVPLAVQGMFTGKPHRFQNIGEGTWYHSGALAVRQAIAFEANITYKILYNDAVAMTGGQPVDGPVSPAAIAQSCRAEGVQRIALVSDDIAKFDRGDFPAGTTFHDRADLDPVQRELREIDGVTVLIYEQTCATEKRRKRKRGLMADPKRVVLINELVCEGCGDCSVQSNCLSVEPKRTEFGIKRQVNQSTCNKDFSCLTGFCPSFVTLEGAVRKKQGGPDAALLARADALPLPVLPLLKEPFDLLITGVGGTGVVTIGALITMAAHLEHKGASVLDFTGFAQKFGTVLSYVRLANDPAAIQQVRIDAASADAVIGCDAVVTSSPKASAHLGPQTRVVLNEAEMPTGDLVLNRDADLNIPARRDLVASVLAPGALSSVDAGALAERVMGEAVFANVILLGFAWQKGLVPVGLAALLRAMEQNGVAVEKNKAAFALGRLAAEDPAALPRAGETPASPETADEIIAHRAAFLVGYQDKAYATRYRATLERFRAALPEARREAWTMLAAKSLFKLMAYKDEYEVARLHSDPGFAAQMAEGYEPGFTVTYHLAPPLLARGVDAQGRPKKRAFGPWMGHAFRVLAKMKRLRGTVFDPFGRQADRRLERALIVEFEAVLARVAKGHGAMDHANVETALAAPMEVRGYGPVKEMAAAEARAVFARTMGQDSAGK